MVRHGESRIRKERNQVLFFFFADRDHLTLSHGELFRRQVQEKAAPERRWL